MPVKSLGVHGNRSIVAVCGVVPVAAIVPSFPVDNTGIIEATIVPSS